MTIVEIPIESRYVNAIVFVVIDIICLWAIHRGLMGIQGFFHSRDIRKGRRVHLKRSSIPIISGELLVQQRKGPNVLVLIHLTALVAAFAVSLGINGTSKNTREVVMRNYLSALEFTPFDEKLSRLRPRVVLRCKDHKDEKNHAITEVHYHRAAFNVTSNARLEDRVQFLDADRKQHHINSTTMECQKDQVLTLSKCEPIRVGCSSARDESVNKLLVTPNNDVNQNLKIGSHQDKLLLRLRTVNQVQQGSDVKRGDSLVCLERPLRGTDLKHENTELFNCVLMRWIDEAKARVAFGTAEISREDVVNDRIDSKPFNLRITTAMGTVDRLGENGELLFAEGLREISAGSYSLEDIVDSVVARSTVAKIATDKNTREVKKNVTEIQIFAVVLLALLFVGGIVLGGMREILMFTSMRKGTYLSTVFDSNRYDMISGLLRNAESEGKAEDERDNKTNQHAVIAAFDVDTGDQRIGVIPNAAEPSVVSSKGGYQASTDV